jgi:hypothetical protein
VKPPFEQVELGAAYDEMFDAEGVPRPQYQALHERVHEEWEALDAHVAGGDFVEMLIPSQFARPSALLAELARELEHRFGDPLSFVRAATSRVHAALTYARTSTVVDSPIDDAVAREAYVRVAIGRDYADVPPTRGVFKSQAETELGLAVARGDALVADEEVLPVTRRGPEPERTGERPMQQQHNERMR